MRKKQIIIVATALLAAALSSCVQDSVKTGGSFKSFSEVRAENVLTIQDIQNICYWNNGEKLLDAEGKVVDQSTYTIKERDPLSDETSSLIISDFEKLIMKPQIESETGADPNGNIKGSIRIYCGKYQNYYAVRFHDFLNLPAAIETEVVDGYTFEYPCLNGQRILFWSANS